MGRGNSLAAEGILYHDWSREHTPVVTNDADCLPPGVLDRILAIALELYPEELEDVGTRDYDHEWCYNVCDQLNDYLLPAGVHFEIIDGGFGDQPWAHQWIQLEDGTILDPTVSQFSDSSFNGDSKYAQWPGRGDEMAIVPTDHPYRQHYRTE